MFLKTDLMSEEVLVYNKQEMQDCKINLNLNYIMVQANNFGWGIKPAVSIKKDGK